MTLRAILRRALLSCILNLLRSADRGTNEFVRRRLSEEHQLFVLKVLWTRLGEEERATFLRRIGVRDALVASWCKRGGE
jgi:hypothetical protein